MLTDLHFVKQLQLTDSFCLNNWKMVTVKNLFYCHKCNKYVQILLFDMGYNPLNSI